MTLNELMEALQDYADTMGGDPVYVTEPAVWLVAGDYTDAPYSVPSEVAPPEPPSPAPAGV